jgi:hypothetical protein
MAEETPVSAVRVRIASAPEVQRDPDQVEARRTLLPAGPVFDAPNTDQAPRTDQAPNSEESPLASAALEPESLPARRQCVVVRSGLAAAPALLEQLTAHRERLPTLLGLGVPELSGALLDAANEFRGRNLPPYRPRAEVLIEDIDDELADQYRAEADRLIASGLFSSIEPVTGTICP